MDDKNYPLVRMKNIDKIFYGSYANRDVDFELFRGEVHSILGENGAGKTTLMNCLAGIYLPDAGTIEIDGKPVILSNPRLAIENGSRHGPPALYARSRIYCLGKHGPWPQR